MMNMNLLVVVTPLSIYHDRNTYNILLVHRYNTRARRMQGHNLMDNHVEIVRPKNPPHIEVPAYSVHKTGEDWAHTNNTTVDATIHMGHINAVIFPETVKTQEYRHLMKGPDYPKRTREFANKIGKLFQGIRYIEGNNTYFFIHKHEVPQDSKVTYSQIVCDIRTQKTETHRLQLTVGGNKISYEVPVSTPTVDLTMTKLHWNSVLSTLDSKYLIVDVKNFYLNTPTKKAVYLKIALNKPPQDITNKHDLLNKQCDGYIYVRIEKGMYGLV